MFNEFYFRTVRNGNESFAGYTGMSLETIEGLFEDMGITEYEQISKEEFEAGLQAQNA